MNSKLELANKIMKKKKQSMRANLEKLRKTKKKKLKLREKKLKEKKQHQKNCVKKELIQA